MTLDTLIMLTGAFVALLPFLGFPNSWDSVLFLVAGILVITFGIIVRRRSHHDTPPEERRNGTFVESLPAQAGTPPFSSEHEKERVE